MLQWFIRFFQFIEFPFNLGKTPLLKLLNQINTISSVVMQKECSFEISQ